MWTPGSVTPPGPEPADAEPIETHARRMATIAPTLGPSIVLKGQISGHEDLVIAGRVEGSIEVLDAAVTIAADARVTAGISARTAIVRGSVAGNITATERVEISEQGSVEGTIVSPRLLLRDGGRVRGKVEMNG
jgi:cytoskeletal protein CcmA (bactofilin family)